MGFLLSNILQQMTAIRQMGKRPTKLVCDPDNFYVLLDEVGPLTSVLNVPVGPLKIYGLEIKLSETPNFEVV